MEELRIGEIYARKRGAVLSFEVFPPKSDGAMAQLRQVLTELAGLRPTFMTVTYGAMGTTRDRTLEIASRIQSEEGIPTACHLTCVGASRGDLTRTILSIAETGLRNIVALRGDPPSGELNFVAPADGLSYGSELVAHIREVERAHGLPAFGIAVAGYPEKHVEAPDLATDLGHLRAKVDAGADAILTQLFFNNAAFFEFERRARAEGVRVPIVPGLLPIVSAKQVVRIASLCGAGLPERLRAELDAAGDDSAKVEEIGIRQCVAQVEELLREGVPGIHFYVLNRSGHMSEILRRVRERGGLIGG